MNEIKKKWIENEINNLKKSFESYKEQFGEENGLVEFLKSVIKGHEFELNIKYSECPFCKNMGKFTLNCGRGCWECKYCGEFEVHKFCNHEL